MDGLILPWVGEKLNKAKEGDLVVSRGVEVWMSLSSRA
jgi:hypothetical protein